MLPQALVSADPVLRGAFLLRLNAELVQSRGDCASIAGAAARGHDDENSSSNNEKIIRIVVILRIRIVMRT